MAARKAAIPKAKSLIAEGLMGLAVGIDDPILDPANARLHPEENLDALMGSLRVFGQRKPIIVNRRNNVVEAGNGTLMAARKLGWDQIAALYVDDDPSVAAGFAIADNRTAELAKWDDKALAKLLHEVEVTDESLVVMMSTLADDNALFDQAKEATAGDGDPAAISIDDVFGVLAECSTEDEQRSLFEELKSRGLKCRVLTV